MYFGEVRQNCGEDWNDVALTLSTSEAKLFGSGAILPRIGKMTAHLRPRSFGGTMAKPMTQQMMPSQRMMQNNQPVSLKTAYGIAYLSFKVSEVQNFDQASMA